MAKAEGSVDALLQEEVPEIGLPLPSIVTLQKGLFDKETDEWQVEAEVRELTGVDEEYLATLESKNTTTYTDYMTALLKRAVVRIGIINIDEHPECVDQLIVGDRDTLFISIIKCTYGVEREFRVSCGSCDEKSDITINLDEDFPLQKPNVNLQEPLKVKLRNGSIVKLRLPNGADGAYVSKHGTTVAAQNTIMLSRCVLMSPSELNGESTEDWAKALNLADRGKLIKTLLDVQSGPKMEGVNVQCAHCGTDLPLNLNWMSLLFG